MFSNKRKKKNDIFGQQRTNNTSKQIEHTEYGQRLNQLKRMRNSTRTHIHNENTTNNMHSTTACI